MRCLITHKEFDRIIEKILNYYPLEIPICFDDFTLGTLIIDFKYNKRKFRKEEKKIRSRLNNFLLDELIYFAPLLKGKIELELRLAQNLLRYLDQINLYFCMWLFPTDLLRSRSKLGFFLYTGEKKIFDLIKSEGPIMLCNRAVQENMMKWLSDEENASMKINKLKESLLEYAFDSLVKHQLFKIGRPESESIRKFGKEKIVFFYHVLISLLRIIKTNEEDYYKNSIKDMIEKAGDELFKKKDFIKEKNEDDLTEQDLIYKALSKDKLRFCFVSWVIEEDEFLKNEYKNFRWEPNKFAKKILSKLLDISVSKLEKLLYSKA